jgi:hypothetical protein
MRNVKDPVSYEEYGTAWNVQSFTADHGGEPPVEFACLSKLTAS